MSSIPGQFIMLLDAAGSHIKQCPEVSSIPGQFIMLLDAGGSHIKQCPELSSIPRQFIMLVVILNSVLIKGGVLNTQAVYHAS